MTPSASPSPDPRRAGLRRHFILAFAVLGAAGAVAVLALPSLLPWVVGVAVAWGAPLALHTAWAAGILSPPRPDGTAPEDGGSPPPSEGPDR